MKSFNDSICARLLLVLCLTATLSRQLPQALAAVTSTGDQSILPTTTYLEGNYESKTTTTEAYPTLYDDSDVFGNSQSYETSNDNNNNNNKMIRFMVGGKMSRNNFEFPKNCNVVYCYVPCIICSCYHCGCYFPATNVSVFLFAYFYLSGCFFARKLLLLWR